jgi:hypothetical protein
MEWVGVGEMEWVEVGEMEWVEVGEMEWVLCTYLPPNITPHLPLPH